MANSLIDRGPSPTFGGIRDDQYIIIALEMAIYPALAQMLFRLIQNKDKTSDFTLCCLPGIRH